MCFFIILVYLILYIGGAPKEDCPSSLPSDCIQYEFPTTPKPVSVEVGKPQLLTTPGMELLI